MNIYVTREDLDDILELFGDARIKSITKVGDNYVIEIKEVNNEGKMCELRERIRRTKKNERQ